MIKIIMSQQARGFTPLITLANFQILDAMFNNIVGSGVGILEEVMCDPASIEWLEFESSIDELMPPEHYRGKSLLMWHKGVSVDESVHGVVRMLTSVTQDIRKTFSFR